MPKPTAAPAAEKGGAAEQAIGITRGGRNSKLHALVDKLCRPWVIILTPGNTADCTVGPQCVSMVAGIKKLLGDKAYDSDSFRKSLKEDGVTPVIPGRANRTKRIRHDKEAMASCWQPSPACWATAARNSMNVGQDARPIHNPCPDCLPEWRRH
jgi:transposase